MIDSEIKNAFKIALGTDETILWTGRPPGGVIFRASDIFLIPFSILWFGFAVFWEVSVVESDAPLLFRLWGIPFLCVGLYISIGRFFIDSHKRKNTVYAITHERILIKSGIFSSEINSVSIRTLSGVTFTTKADGSGTIILGPENDRYGRMQGLDWPGVKQTPRLESIPNVKGVYDIIMDNQRKP
ncbi:PH domain-containing protein [Flavobacterium psychrotrophum]|uniref:PH domain-containing protein n=1 Tax=Flavobacterium psychrotrophum TaxID=2294119 RepID=UPI000E3167DF|nr:PH domain-containing protein [Flavobacterium psychrotrophum]